MATFEYKARSQEGEIRSGVIDASSEEAALDLLQQNSLVVLSIKKAGRTGWLETTIALSKRVSPKDVVIFSRQLATLFEARVPVVQALKTLISETTKPALRSAIDDILNDVGGGMALSQAMSKHPYIFSAFYINLIRSGEESGKLQEVFTYLAEHLERSYYLTTKARNALIYPAFVLFAFIGVLIVMLVVVVPRLISIFEETGQTVPFYTQAIIYLSLLLRQWGLALLVLIIAGAVFLWRWSFTKRGKFFFHSIQINAPLVGGLYRKLFMARLTDNLRTLIISGIPIIRALSVTSDVVGNVVYKKSIEEAIESVKAGSTISAALERTPEIPVLVTQMIRIGEASGRLDFMLGSVAKFYQREVDSTLEGLVALIEPALITFLGLGIGVLVASILVPLYNLVGAL